MVVRRVVTTAIQLRFDCRATPVRLQFDPYDHSTTYVTLHFGLNK